MPPGFQANRNVRTLFSLVSRGLAVRRAPRRPDPPVVCPGFPGHALHEKGLYRQIAVGTLVNSQERRALAVPRINRGQTADEPVVNRGFRSPTGLHGISFVRACEESFRTVVYGTLEG